MSISLQSIRSYIPYILCAFLGTITLGEYYIVNPTIKAMSTEIGNWVVIISGFILFMATVRGYLYNIRVVHDRRKGIWPYSIYLLAFTTVYMIIGIWEGVAGVNYSWVQIWIFAGLMGTIQAYFLLAICFRAYRARNIMGGAIVISMAMYLIYLIPLGDFIPGLPFVAEYMFSNIMTPSLSGILMGSGIGAIFIAIRTIIGRERRSLGG